MTNEKIVERTYKDAFHLAAFLEDIKRNGYATQKTIEPTIEERTGRYTLVRKEECVFKEFLVNGPFKISVLEKHVDFGLWSVPVFDVTLSGLESDVDLYLKQAESFARDYSNRLSNSIKKHASNS